MTRELLISAIKETVEQLGYSFYSGSENKMAGLIKEFPAAWLSPLEIINVSGHRECHVTYRASLRLITLCGFAKIDNESLWQIIEADALQLYHLLGEHKYICLTENFKSIPSTSFVTKSGDISLNIEFDIETLYCI